jgi:hypothetical protein
MPFREPFENHVEHHRALGKALDWYGYRNLVHSLGVMLLGLAVALIGMGHTQDQALLLYVGYAVGGAFLGVVALEMYCLKRAKHFGRLANPS